MELIPIHHDQYPLDSTRYSTINTPSILLAIETQHGSTPPRASFSTPLPSIVCSPNPKTHVKNPHLFFFFFFFPNPFRTEKNKKNMLPRLLKKPTKRQKYPPRHTNLSPKTIYVRRNAHLHLHLSNPNAGVLSLPELFTHTYLPILFTPYPFSLPRTHTHIVISQKKNTIKNNRHSLIQKKTHSSLNVRTFL